MWDALLQHSIALMILAILLAISATFAASETALFSLSRLQLRQLRQEKGMLSAMIVRMMSKPRELLVIILLGNMFVNISYASLSAVVALQLWQDSGWLAPVFFEFVAISLLILMSEITPKFIALQMPLVIARLTIPVLTCSNALLAPLRNLFNRIAQWFSSFFLPQHPESFITDEELLYLLHVSETAGVIEVKERELFQEVLSLRHLRVKELMRPRVDIVMHKLGTDIRESMLRAEGVRQRIIPVYDTSIDDILGAVKMRDLLLYPQAELSELTHPAPFIPEVKNIDSLLKEFIDQRTSFALAVDEFGGIAGYISIDDIIMEIFGSLGPDHSGPHELHRISDGIFEVPGRLPLHQLQDIDLHLSERGITTIAGYVQAHLHEAAQVGNVITQKNVTFTVIQIEQGRITKIRLELTPGATQD